jgi:DNA modification methylase
VGGVSVAAVLAGERRWWIECADVLDALRAMPSESVHCVCTSPPYFGLRDYGTAKWEGGEPGCDHVEVRKPRRDSTNISTGNHWKETRGTQPHTDFAIGYRDVCGRCGATRADKQIGLEPTPAAFVEAMVDVCREVRRILRKDGTFWLNLGDSYAAKGRMRSDEQPHKNQTVPEARLKNGPSVGRVPGLKPKDLLGIPWRVAFALQDDGWYLRSGVTWCKKSAMPESVGDRPTSATEMIFLLTKLERYYYDADAVREPLAESTIARISQNDGHPVWNGDHQRGYPGSPQTLDITRLAPAEGRNLRNFWLLGPEPYPDAHFAVFPTEIPRRAILAGSPADGVVLDPFSGSGTTVLVALRLGRRGVGIELNPKYVALSRARVVNDSPMFNTEGVA